MLLIGLQLTRSAWMSVLEKCGGPLQVDCGSSAPREDRGSPTDDELPGSATSRHSTVALESGRSLTLTYGAAGSNMPFMLAYDHSSFRVVHACCHGLPGGACV